MPAYNNASGDYRVPPYLEVEERELLEYLHGLYDGVFADGVVRRHLENHVGYAFADYTTAVINPRLTRGARVLDVGCGFGSTVISAREAGFDAFGVEIAPFEVAFARRRLARVRPDDSPEAVFIEGDATKLDLEPGSLDAITFWNVLEHIESCDTMLETAWSLLKPGGLAYVICPNYAAERLEAHYHVPWKPELRHDRAKAAAYLRSLGRNPAYFETSIFCRTNSEVLGVIKRLGFEPLDIADHRSMALSVRNLPSMLIRPNRFSAFHSSVKESVMLVARKPMQRI